MFKTVVMVKIVGPYFFLKFGKKEHLIDLQKNGHLFFNTFKYFTEIEDGNVRGDIDETVVKQLQGEIKVIRNDNFPNGYINLNIPGILQLRDNIGNMFCLYTIDTQFYNRTFKYQFDQRLNEFQKEIIETDKCSLIILNVPEFLKRVKENLDRRKLLFSMDVVKYVDMKIHSGNKTPFLKDYGYSYQNEYRIVIYQQQCLIPISLHIGNIEDISMLVEKDISNIDLEFHYSE
jgi:hypothetical protein